MIISQTPYRISFFGGGSDYPEWYLENGGQILSSTIDKHIYITCRYLPPFFSHKHRIVYSKVEEVKKTNDIKHNVVREILKHLKINNGMEIHYDGDLPARSGMGSSSTFVVGLMNTLFFLKNKKINKKILAKSSIHFEQNILKETVGSQDQIAAAYGGFNNIKLNHKGDFSVNKIKIEKKDLIKFNENLVLLYTGVKRTANDVANTYVKKLKKEKRNEMLRIVECADEGKKLLQSKNFDDFGRLLHYSWLAKKKLSKVVSSSSIDSIYDLAIKKGALGGKLLGAGGGGFLLLYVPKSIQKRFMQHFTKFVHIPFTFENSGSKIIFNMSVDLYKEQEIRKEKNKFKNFKELKI